MKKELRLVPSYVMVNINPKDSLYRILTMGNIEGAAPYGKFWRRATEMEAEFYYLHQKYCLPDLLSL